jgi:hypothetical protein
LQLSHRESKSALLVRKLLQGLNLPILLPILPVSELSNFHTQDGAKMEVHSLCCNLAMHSIDAVWFAVMSALWLQDIERFFLGHPQKWFGPLIVSSKDNL